MVEIETDGTHACQEVLRQLGRPSPQIDPTLEHILITGMFHTFCELIIHEMLLKDAENYVREMRAFYTAGWMKIMGQQCLIIFLWQLGKLTDVRGAMERFHSFDINTKKEGFPLDKNVVIK